MFAYGLEHICSYSARLQNPPEVIGPVPEGIRVNFYVTSGEVTGPKIRGILRPVGGDWFTIRTDGIGLLDVRATIETHDHALIFVAYTGVGDLGEDGYHKFLQGALPPRVPLRVVPRFQTTHPTYQWLNPSGVALPTRENKHGRALRWQSAVASVSPPGRRSCIWCPGSFVGPLSFI